MTHRLPAPARPPNTARPAPFRLGRAATVCAYVLAVIVLALVFWTYQSPDMRLNWEALAALCGF